MRHFVAALSLVMAMAMPVTAMGQPRPAEGDGAAPERGSASAEDGESTGDDGAGDETASDAEPGDPTGDDPTGGDAPGDGEAGDETASDGEPGDPGDAPPSTVDAKSVCLESFGRAQRMRREAMLLEARQELLACAQDGCFDAVRVKCMQWLEEVDSDIPTLVIAIKDKSGETPRDARVLIDGGGASAALGGRALEVNPGTHEMSVTLPSGERMVKSVTILQGQKNQSVVFDFTPPEEPMNTLPPQVIVRDGSTNVPAVVAFGVGGAALVAGIITGVVALRDGDDKAKNCDEIGCDSGDIDDYTLAHVSTASFVLAGVGAALGLTFLFVFDDDDETRTDVAMTAGPAGASLRVRF